MPLLQPWSCRLGVCTQTHTRTPRQLTYAHLSTYTHPGEILSPLSSRGDLYWAEKQVGWHFAALELRGGFERKYTQLCLWNALARMCKDFELSPHLCRCWTLVAVACAFLFIWQDAATFFLSFFFWKHASLDYSADYLTACRASNK